MHIRALAVSLAALGAVLALATFAAVSQRQGPVEQPPEPAAPIVVHGFGAAMSPEALVYRSDVAVIGVVTAVSEPRWSTPDGKAPEGWRPGKVLREPELAYRVVDLEVKETLFGDASSALSVALLGGDDESLIDLPDLVVPPNVRAGQEVLLFIVHPAPGWRLGADNQGLLQGYEIVGGVLHAEGEAPALSLRELETRVAAELIRKSSGAVEPASP